VDLTLTMISRVIVAAVLGALLGVERSRAGQSAGVRTNMMISVAACMFTFLGAEVFPVGEEVDDTEAAAVRTTDAGSHGRNLREERLHPLPRLAVADAEVLRHVHEVAPGPGIDSIRVQPRRSISSIPGSMCPSEALPRPLASFREPAVPPARSLSTSVLWAMSTVRISSATFRLPSAGLTAMQTPS